MVRSVRSRVLLGAGLLAIGWCAAVVAQGKPVPEKSGPNLKVGVVDIGTLFKKYSRKDQLESQINKEREEMRKQVEAEEKRLTERRAAIDQLYKRGSEAWEVEVEKLQLEAKALEMKEQRLQRVLKKRVEEFTLRVLTELEATIARYGQDHSFSLILKVDKSARDPNQDAGELAAQFQERIFRAQISDVLYHHDNVDVTNGVLALLNDPRNIAENEKLTRDSPSGAGKTPPPPASGG